MYVILASGVAATPLKADSITEFAFNAFFIRTTISV